MSDNTLLNPGAAGDTIRTEDVGSSVKVPVSKIHTGDDGVDGGSVTAVNPFFVSHVSGSITGLQVGGVALSSANPAPVTGSVFVINPVNFNNSGQLLSGSAVRTVQYTFGDFGTSGSANQVIASQGAGNRIRVLSAHLMASAPVNVRWKSAGGGGSFNDISGRFYIPASGGFVLPHNEMGWMQTNTNEGLNIALDSSTTVGVIVTWILAGA